MSSTNLENAIKYIESRVSRRWDSVDSTSNEDRTALTVEEAKHLLSLLRAHGAEEYSLQLDIKLERDLSK